MSDSKSKSDNNNLISQKDENENTKNPDIRLQISDDYYEAYISIKFNNNYTNITKDTLLDFLKSKNIVYGINDSLINKIIEDQKEVANLLVAKGKKHINGTDGKIDYSFDVNNELRPEILKDGKVDHKNLNYVQEVRRGNILAKIIQPTSGEDGITVTGRKIIAKPGKNASFSKGKNTLISNDGMYLLADSDGQIRIENEKISIMKVLEINEDVGIATGNINFNGKIVINGNVNIGYSVESKDDLEINGVVEGAKLISGGNIIIKKGVHNHSHLYASNNIYSKFMENCYVKVDKNLVCDVIMHCNVESEGSIIANDKKGLIIGGNLTAKKEIIAKNLGSEIGTITKLQLGIDNSFINNINKTRDLIIETKNNIKKLKQAITILKSQNSNNPSDKKIKDMLSKTLHTKELYTSEIKKLEERLNKMNDYIKSSKDCKVSAYIFYPGVKIKINNSHYNVKNVFQNSQLVLENGEIKVGSYS